MAFFKFTGILFCTALISGCLHYPVKATGPVETREHSFAQVHRLSLSGGGTLCLSNGAEPLLSVTAPESFHRALDIRARDGHLIIRNREDGFFDPDEVLHYELTVPELERISVSGVVRLCAVDFVSAQLIISASGAAEFDLHLTSERIEIRASGAADGYLAGTTDELWLRLSGASSVRGFDLSAQAVNVDISGAGDASVTALDQLYARISGAGDIRYRGDPKVNKTVTGLGSIQAAASP